MVRVTILPVLQDNYSYFLEAEDGTTAIIDPSAAEPVLAFLQAHGKPLHYILNTHHHADHVGGNLELSQETGAIIAGFQGDSDRIPGQYILLRDQDLFKLGNSWAQILHIPGHTLGHIAYYFESESMLFTGDTLFSLGCGRLFEGTPEAMWHSLSRLMSLPDETKVYCGHEYTLANLAFARSLAPNDDALKKLEYALKEKRQKDLPTLPSTLGFEKIFNPFLTCIHDASPVEAFTKRRALKDAFNYSSL
ncbi:MAG: hydroxyacylglutathione hydrolase [Alphaproteobacteria bacterium]|jgi:hydroxyacylglutathione hydrolase|nr:hydroxyacylglutathione hydrolase [Alphaproteobacteria bacterium]